MKIQEGAQKKRKGERAKRDDATQSRLFIKKAREIDADEKASASDQLLGQLAKMKPNPRRSKNKDH